MATEAKDNSTDTLVAQGPQPGARRDALGKMDLQDPNGVDAPGDDPGWRGPGRTLLQALQEDRAFTSGCPGLEPALKNPQGPHSLPGPLFQCLTGLTVNFLST